MQQRLRSLSQRLDPLWWNTGMLFISSRLGDVMSLIIGIFIVPRVISTEDLGAIIPLTQLGIAFSLPAQVVVLASIKFMNTYAVQGELGKVKSMLHDLGRFALIVSGGLALLLYVRRSSILEGLDVSSPAIIWLVGSIIIAANLQPIATACAQALKAFHLLSVAKTLSPLARLITILLFLKPLQVTGYLLSLLAARLTAIILLVSCVKKYLVKSTAPAPYREDLPRILRFALPTGLMMGSIVLLQTIEPWTVRTLFDAEESAAFYMIQMFGNLPLWIAPAMLPFLFPIASERFEKGESTHGIHTQSLLVVTGIGLAITLALWIGMPYVMTLQANWAPYAHIGPYVTVYALVASFTILMQTHFTHESACRQWSFLSYLIGFALMECALLVWVVPQWPSFHTRLPTALATMLDDNLSWVLACMLLTRLAWAACIGFEMILRQRKRKRTA
jgi:O-antigen/teichoic acid export membrane protein